MSAVPSHATVDEINALLDRERAVLLSGALDDMAALSEEKEQMVARLSQAMPHVDPQSLARIKEKTARNGRLYAAVLEGCDAVTQRLKDIVDAKDSLRTYTNDGRLNEKTKRHSKFEAKS